MDHFAGLDVSVRETSVCIVDDLGKIVRALPTTSSELDWKPGRCPNGFTLHSLKRSSR
jgi:hypothetical protein